MSVKIWIFAWFMAMLVVARIIATRAGYWWGLHWVLS